MDQDVIARTVRMQQLIQSNRTHHTSSGPEEETASDLLTGCPEEESASDLLTECPEEEIAVDLSSEDELVKQQF